MIYKKYEIRKMAENELAIALDWAGQEGWNLGIEDAKTFYQADKNGFFIGTLEGEPIATGAAIAYDEFFGFCGLYIVKPEYRNRGYGMKLTEQRLSYLGERIVGLDGVLNNAAKYERIGYVPAHLNTRYVCQDFPAFSTAEYVVPLGSISFSEIEALDRKYFPSARPAFLKAWISQANGFALGYKQNDKLKGFGVIRRCQEGFKIGPLFAESFLIAQALFEALCLKAGQGPIFLDIPEPNKQALELVQQYRMTPVFEVLRMYRNGFPQMDISGIFGITTYELG
ncbi:MAG: GNAT family N-acetyltransferase [Parachlamydia sp.]|jgi:GNAT superfamily N-acetyltransferase|nr:GNAT family N-acetyltransferase [Parachlamydia sp.]